MNKEKVSSFILIFVIIVGLFFFDAFSKINDTKYFLKENFPPVFIFYLSSLNELDSNEEEFLYLLCKLSSEEQEYYGKKVFEEGFSVKILNEVKKSIKNQVPVNIHSNEKILQEINNYQNPSTVFLHKRVLKDSKDPDTVYPQTWATGDGTASNPWANDCINKAYNAVPTGGTIYLETGYYKTSTTIGNAWAPTKNFNLIGEGIGKSIIILDTENEAGISLYESDHCTLKGFTVDGDSQGDNTHATIVIYKCDYITVEDVEAKNSGRFGIDFAESSYTYCYNVYAHDNYSHGIHPGADIKGRNTNNVYRDIYCYNNGKNGFDDYGYQGDENNNEYDNLQCWDNEILGIALQFLKNCILSNSFSSGNGKYGIWIWDNEDLNVQDCLATLSGDTGVYINISDNISFMNLISKNNNGEAGISINDSNGLKFTFCQSYDDRDNPSQLFGIVIGEDSNNNNYIKLTDCILMPNKIAAIYNDTGQ